MDTAELILTLSVPGWVLVLLAVGAFELLRKKRRGGGTPISGTFVDEFTAALYGGKRVELDHRASTSMMYEDDARGAPPRHGVDLDNGVARVRPKE